MRITLEPRKTTWVPFINCKAKLEVEWTAKIEYSDWSVHQNATHPVEMRYTFSGLDGAQFIPSSQLIIKEKGIPLTITETVASPAKDRFKSERIRDPFVEIDDKLASIEKSKVLSKPLSKRMIERSWVETIERSLKIENKTGKQVRLKLTVVDKPASDLVFVSSAPVPTGKESPEYLFHLELAPDTKQVIKIVLKLHKVEKLELPPEQVKISDEPHNRNVAVANAINQPMEADQALDDDAAGETVYRYDEEEDKKE